MGEFGIMKIITLMVVFLSASIIQAQSFDWAITSQGEQVNEGNAVCFDAEGNSYVTGSFSSPKFVLGGLTLTNTTPVPTNPLRTDMFAAKIDAAGKVIWAIQSNGTGDEKGVALLVIKPDISWLPEFLRVRARLSERPS